MVPRPFFVRCGGGTIMSPVFLHCRMLILEPCKIPILLGSCRYLVLICRIHRPWWVTKAVMENVTFFSVMFCLNTCICVAQRNLQGIFWKWDKGGAVPLLKDCGSCLNILEVRYSSFNWLRIAVQFSGIFSTKVSNVRPLRTSHHCRLSFASTFTH